MPSFIRNALALSAFAAAATAQSLDQLAQEDSFGTNPKVTAVCADVVIVEARGNNAPYHDSRIFPFVTATCDKLKAVGKTCDYIDVVFGTMENGDFCTQIQTGVKNGMFEITEFNKKCPCSHIILNGFSQGAWITGDILAGPGGCAQITTGLDSATAPGSAIAAALVFGDVMHEANEPYNVRINQVLSEGAALQKDGRSADSLARLNARYSDKLRSYCQEGDPVCANGNNIDMHLNYFDRYNDDASTWAVGKIMEAAPLCAAPTPSASASVVASSTPVASSSAAPSSVKAGSVTVSASASASASASVVASSSAAASSSAGGSKPAASSSVKVLPPMPTSPVFPAPVPKPVPYEPTCVPIMKIQYVYV